VAPGDLPKKKRTPEASIPGDVPTEAACCRRQRCSLPEEPASSGASVTPPAPELVVDHPDLRSAQAVTGGRARYQTAVSFVTELAPSSITPASRSRSAGNSSDNVASRRSCRFYHSAAAKRYSSKMPRHKRRFASSRSLPTSRCV
jgi:hypothetical protein